MLGHLPYPLKAVANSWRRDVLSVPLNWTSVSPILMELAISPSASINLFCLWWYGCQLHDIRERAVIRWVIPSDWYHWGICCVSASIIILNDIYIRNCIIPPWSRICKTVSFVVILFTLLFECSFYNFGLVSQCNNVVFVSNNLSIPFQEHDRIQQQHYVWCKL